MKAQTRANPKKKKRKKSMNFLFEILHSVIYKIAEALIFMKIKLLHFSFWRVTGNIVFEKMHRRNFCVLI